MIRKVVNLVVRLTILLFLFQDSCDARWNERERGRRFKTRSLPPDSSNLSSKGKAGKSSSENNGGIFYVTEATLVEVRGACKEKHGGVKRRAGGKDSKSSSCVPSAQPSTSLAPSNSVVPSENPTRSSHPSSSPSANPSGSPTASAKPSFTPSDMPSAEPSKNPSASPSVFPSSEPSVSPSGLPSLYPSQSPSRLPSFSPSEYPSGFPSTSPSDKPSNSPSQFPSSLPSRSPTESPTKLPSEYPTGTPSRSPSRSPSFTPSMSPTVSPSIEPSTNPTTSSVPTKSSSPTGQICETTMEGSNSEKVIVTSRIEPEPDEARRGNFDKDQRLVFQYLVIVKASVEKEVIASELENSIHRGLAEYFVCQGIREESESFYIWLISSHRPDFILAESCESTLSESNNKLKTNDDSQCIVIQAYLTMHAYFPLYRLRRDLNEKKPRFLAPKSTTNADQQVINTFRDFLTSAMENGEFNDERVQQTKFLAFVMEESTHSTLDRGDLNVAGANTQLQNGHEDSRVVAGAMTMAAATTCLIIVAIIILRRRKQRLEAYISHVEELSTFSGFDWDKDEFDRDTYIVGDNDGSSVDWFRDDRNSGIGYNVEGDREKVKNERIPVDYQQNVHKCTSAYCETCNRHKSTAPTFIAPGSVTVYDILEDLRCASSIMEERSYSTPDTVNL